MSNRDDSHAYRRPRESQAGCCGIVIRVADLLDQGLFRNCCETPPEVIARTALDDSWLICITTLTLTSPSHGPRAAHFTLFFSTLDVLDIQSRRKLILDRFSRSSRTYSLILRRSPRPFSPIDSNSSDCIANEGTISSSTFSRNTNPTFIWI